MESNLTKRTLNDILKRLDIALLDDNTYKRLLDIASEYEYIDTDLLKQAIEAELIITLYKR